MALAVFGLLVAPAFGDGICKKDPVPAAYAPIAEFNSPQCDYGSDPFAMNAWELGRIADGIVSCQPIDYANADAPAVAYVTCRRVASEGCPGRRDGGPNAYLLRTPDSCRADLDYAGLTVGLSCATDNGAALSARFVGISFTFDLALFSRPNATSCEVGKPGIEIRSNSPLEFYRQTGTEVGRLEIPDSFSGVVPYPLCVVDAGDGVTQWRNSNNVDWMMGRKFTGLVVVRRFFSAFCPATADGAANAVVVAQKLHGRNLVCADSFSGSTLSELKLVHDDSCGSDAGDNAVWIDFPEAEKAMPVVNGSPGPESIQSASVPVGWDPCGCPSQHAVLGARGVWVGRTFYHPDGPTCL